MAIETIGESIIKILPDLISGLAGKINYRQAQKTDLNEQLLALGNLLTGRLVYLLRYLDQSGDARYPHAYGRILSAYVDVGNTRPDASFSAQAEVAWEHASKYACWYLSSLGLVKQYGAIGGEVAISDLGRELLRSDRLRELYRPAFEQRLTLY